MGTNSTNGALAASEKIYGWLLRAYPPAHRAAYGAAMAQLFRDQCRDAWRESQNWGLLKLWLRVLPDLVSTSIRERLAALKERKSMTDKLANLNSFQTSPAKVFLRVFIVVFLLVVLASVTITFLLPETYASTARIKIERDQASANQSGANYDPYFIQTTFEIMLSQLVLDSVIDKLNLNYVWGKKYFNGEPLKTTGTLEILKARLQLTPVRNTMLINITAFSEDKVEAAKIANAVAEAYRDYREKCRREASEKMLGALQAKIQTWDEQIKQQQSEVDLLGQDLKRIGDPVAIPSAHEAEYYEKLREMMIRLDNQKYLTAQLNEQKLAAQFPVPTLVTITDSAQPGHAPVKPNKTVNIALGVFFGIFAASVLGAITAFVAAKFGKRNQRANAAA